MAWFLFAIAGYFLYAFVTVINKFLLRQPATTRPLVFTFWVGILSIFVLVLAPFGLSWPGWAAFVYDLILGLIFFVYLFTFYRALDINEASRTAPVIGGLMPILVLLFSWLFLNESLTWLQIFAFLMLISGGFIISLEKSRGSIHEGLRGIKTIALAILLGAVYMVLIKYAFTQQGFINGFIWSRFGLAAAALAILLRPGWRKMIFSSARQVSGGLGSLLVSGKLLAALGSLLVHLAVAQGSVSIVSAMAGAEYIFLFFIVLLLSKKFPQILKERLNAGVIAQKIIAILLVGAGLAILAI